MTKRTFKSELESLVFSLSALVTTSPHCMSDSVPSRILDDINQTLQYRRLERRRRYLIWGLLVGRCVDAFTKFFLRAKSESISDWRRDTFNNRIKEICRTSSPLTRDPGIRDDLDEVRNLRNDLFHDAGRHFTDEEMQTFLFNSVNCVLQLVRDL